MNVGFRGGYEGRLQWRTRMGAPVVDMKEGFSGVTNEQEFYPPSS